MITSKNNKVDLNAKGNYLKNFTSRGDIYIGDKAFEYYNEKNPRDYIQIPYSEISLVGVRLLFGKKILRFKICTRSNGDFEFNSSNNKKILLLLQTYLGKEKIRKIPSILDKFKDKNKK